MGQRLQVGRVRSDSGGFRVVEKSLAALTMSPRHPAHDVSTAPGSPGSARGSFRARAACFVECADGSLAQAVVVSVVLRPAAGHVVGGGGGGRAVS